VSKPSKTTSAENSGQANRSPCKEGRPTGQRESKEGIPLKRIRLRCGRRDSRTKSQSCPSEDSLGISWRGRISEDRRKGDGRDSDWMHVRGFGLGSPDSWYSLRQDRPRGTQVWMHQSFVGPLTPEVSGRAGREVLCHTPALLPKGRPNEIVQGNL